MSKNLRETIKLIEKLSLIKITDYSLAEKRLQHTINLANKLQEIDITGVEPLYTVLEDYNLQLREDKPIGSIVKKYLVMRNELITVISF